MLGGTGGKGVEGGWGWGYVWFGYTLGKRMYYYWQYVGFHLGLLWISD